MSKDCSAIIPPNVTFCKTCGLEQIKKKKKKKKKKEKGAKKSKKSALAKRRKKPGKNIHCV